MVILSEVVVREAEGYAVEDPVYAATTTIRQGVSIRGRWLHRKNALLRRLCEWSEKGSFDCESASRSRD
jgi:hypothetical protein